MSVMVAFLFATSMVTMIAISNTNQELAAMQLQLDELEETSAYNDLYALALVDDELNVLRIEIEDLLDKPYLSDYTEPEMQRLVIDTLNDILQDEEVLADLVTEVLEDYGFYDELDLEVYELMEDFFLQMMLDIMAELEAEQAGGN